MMPIYGITPNLQILALPLLIAMTMACATAAGT